MWSEHFRAKQRTARVKGFAAYSASSIAPDASQFVSLKFVQQNDAMSRFWSVRSTHSSKWGKRRPPTVSVCIQAEEKALDLVIA
jgi:hypothetical protein